MRITIEKYQHRLLSRALAFLVAEAKEQSSYGAQKVTHPFGVDELTTLLLRINPEALPPKVVEAKPAKAAS